MQSNNTWKFESSTRDISTSNFDALAKFQTSKNRHYTQLQPGRVTAKYIEASLGPLQIFRETLNIGSRIEASPASQFVPFAFILPKSSFRFCGHEHSEGAFVQASGGIWDISFQGELDYIATAFNKDFFTSSCEKLLGRAPQQFFASKITPTLQSSSKNYARSACNILSKLHANALHYQSEHILSLVNSQLVRLTIDVLAHSEINVAIKAQPKRILGVKRVIEYLQFHASELPDIQTLCFIAELSERSLQYGFIEYLGLTPIQYLRIVRLNGVRADLFEAHQSTNTVSDIALKWGFIEFGRFSKDYKQLFLELPSKTLRQ